jgi:hypothetical protein
MPNSPDPSAPGVSVEVVIDATGHGSGRATSPADFRLLIPSGWSPGEALDRVPREMLETGHGLRSVLLPTGEVARFELTAAFDRARQSGLTGDDLDDLVDEIAGSWWSDGVELGFVHVTTIASTSGPVSEETGPLAGLAAGAGVSRGRRVRVESRRLILRSRRARQTAHAARSSA